MTTILLLRAKAARPSAHLGVVRRDDPRGGEAERVAEETLDVAQLTGETRETIGTALRAAVQLEIPFS